MITELPVFIKK